MAQALPACHGEFWVKIVHCHFDSFYMGFRHLFNILSCTEVLSTPLGCQGWSLQWWNNCCWRVLATATAGSNNAFLGGWWRTRLDSPRFFKKSESDTSVWNHFERKEKSLPLNGHCQVVMAFLHPFEFVYLSESFSEKGLCLSGRRGEQLLQSGKGDGHAATLAKSISLDPFRHYGLNSKPRVGNFGKLFLHCL